MPELGEIRKGSELGHKSSTRHIWIACPTCREGHWVPYIRESPLRSYCKSCAHKGDKNQSWKGGRVNHVGYIKVKCPEHHRRDKDGYVLEHILVWETANSQILPSGWVIHHLNGIKSDNRLENLAALSSSKHFNVLGAKAKRIQELEARLRQQGQLV